jgi:2-keto-4-pentenoate hydratase/2-oxohepta-3-ene-1,7-dioic acid hydratase in catechol pathway
MRILFDQATPLPLRAYLNKHEVRTASQQSWATFKNRAGVYLVQFAADILQFRRTPLRGQSPDLDIGAIPADLVAMISQRMTLCPGDVIATGSPPGPGPLAVGDTVEVTIGGIGTLRSHVVPRVLDDLLMIGTGGG